VLTADQRDIAPPTAIAAAGTATRDELLPTEGQTAIAAVACFYKNSDFVYEHKKAAGFI
jgi:hypothetical protein